MLKELDRFHDFSNFFERFAPNLTESLSIASFSGRLSHRFSTKLQNFEQNEKKQEKWTFVIEC